MTPSLLMHLGAWAPLSPAAVAFFHRDRTPARRWVAVWCMELVAANAVSLGLGSVGINNHWLGHVLRPVLGGTALYALSRWQTAGLGRLALTIAIPVFMSVSLVISFAIEDPSTFSLFVAPFHSLVLVCAGLWTFVNRGVAEQRPYAGCDWFWIIGGMVVYAGTSTIREPVSLYLMSRRPELIMNVFNANAVANLVAFAAMTWGMLCPTLPRSSGGSSSQRPSRLGF